MASTNPWINTQDAGKASTRDILILLGMALGLGLFFIFLALFCECFCCRRRRQNTAVATGVSVDQHNENIKGLDPSSIASLPIFEYKRFGDDNNGGGGGWAQCAVCLNMVQEGEKLRQLPNCKHMFHPECVDMWLHSHSTCPLCRSMVSPVRGKNDQMSDADASSLV